MYRSGPAELDSVFASPFLLLLAFDSSSFRILDIFYQSQELNLSEGEMLQPLCILVREKCTKQVGEKK
jgi:hypothetical protein